MKQKTKKIEFIKNFGALALLALIVTFASNNTGASDGTLLPSAAENPGETQYSLLFSNELAPQASVAFGDFGEWFLNPLDNTPAIELPLPNQGDIVKPNTNANSLYIYPGTKNNMAKGEDGLAIEYITSNSPFVNYVDGTLFYNNNDENPSNFTIHVTAQDSEAGIVEVIGSEAFEDTPISTQPPYTLDYSIEQGSICPESRLTITAVAGSGLTESMEIDCILDGNGPVNGSIDYANGFQNSTNINIMVDPGTDAISGMSQNAEDYLLEYKAAPLENGSCGEFGEWKDAGINEISEATSYIFKGRDSSCYQFRYSAKDHLSNRSVYTNGAIIKVDTSASVLDSISINQDAEITDNSAVTLALSAKDAITGRTMMQLSCNHQIWTDMEPFVAEKQFDLTSFPSAGCNKDEGKKTVYARFSNKDGEWEDVVSDSIFYNKNNTWTRDDEPEKKNSELWEEGGMADQFSPEMELPELRDAYAKHFRKSNGSLEAAISSAPVHYEENGQWKEIIDDIEPNASGEHTDYEYATVHNKVKRYSPKDAGSQGRLMDLGQQVYKSWIDPEMQWIDADGKTLSTVSGAVVEGVADANRMIYSNVFDDTDVIFTQGTVSTTMDIVLNSEAALEGIPENTDKIAYCEDITIPNDWTYNTQTDPTNPDKIISVIFSDNQGRDALIYPQPEIYEQNNPEKIILGEYGISKNDDTITVCKEVPIDWLTAPQRQFPVVVDPTEYLGANYQTGTTYWSGTLGGTTTGTNKWNADVDVGCWSNSSTIYCPTSVVWRRGWAYFPTDTIMDGSTLSTTSASYVRMHSNSISANMTIYAYALTTEYPLDSNSDYANMWTDSTSGGIWDYFTVTSPYYDYFCIKGTCPANASYETSDGTPYSTSGETSLEASFGGNNWWGIALKRSSESTYGHHLVRFDGYASATGSYRPFLYVNYDTPTITVSNVTTSYLTGSYYYFTSGIPIYYSGPNIGSGTCYGHVDTDTTYGGSIGSGNLGYDCTGSISGPTCTNGTIYYGCIYPCDANGACANYSCDSTTRIRCDASTPTGTFSITPLYYGPNTYSTTTTIAGTAYDAYSGVDSVTVNIVRNDNYSWNGSGWATGSTALLATGTTSWYYSGISSVNYGNGSTYTISPTIWDKVGNYGFTTTLGDPLTDSFTWDSTSPSIGTPTIYSGTVSNNQYFKGTIYLRSPISDGLSGIKAGSCWVAINGAWTQTGVSQDSNYCYYSGPLSSGFTPNADFTAQFYVEDNVNNSAYSTVQTYTYDSTNPVINYFNVPASNWYNYTEEYSFSWSASDTLSGIFGYYFYIANAVVSSTDGIAEGICGTYGSWINNFSGVGAGIQVNLNTGCSKYYLLVYDNLNNYIQSFPADVTKIDTTYPSAPTSVSYTDGFSSTGNTTIYWNPGFDYESGISQWMVNRAYATLSNGICGAYTSYSGYAGIGTGTGTGQRNYSPPAQTTGYCFKYSVSSQNNALLSTESTQPAYVFKVDTSAPSAPSNLSYTDGYNTTGSQTVSWTNGTDGESGIAGHDLYYNRAPLSNGVCGTYLGWSSEAGYETSPFANNGMFDGWCYKYYVQSVNNSGLTATTTTSPTAETKVDATAPVISSLSDNGATNKKSGDSVTITFNVVETYSGITTNPTVSITQSNDTLIGTASYSSRSGTGNPYSYTYTYTVPTGNYSNVKIKVNATDNASNSATQAVLSPAFNIDNTAPTVTINQASGQSDPTNSSPINYTVVFSESVTGFATGDVTIGGTASGTKTGTVTGSGTTYNVAVSGMTGSGTVIATIASSRATDAAGNGNAASTSSDNTVTYDITPPTATINTITTPRNTALGTVTGTSADNVGVSYITTILREGSSCDAGNRDWNGTAWVAACTASVPHTGTTSWSVTSTPAVGDMVSGKTYRMYVQAYDAAGNGSGWTSQAIFFDNTAPTGGSFTINSGATYTTSQTGNTLNVTCPTDAWATVQMAYGNTAAPTNWTTCAATVSSYDLGAGQGTKTVYMRFRDGGSNTTSDTTDTITLDSVAPTVTINQAGAQADPTNGSPINYTVVFSESVTGFATGDVTLTGTAGATTGTVTGSGTTYNVAVSGMTGSGTVIATIAASRATDAAGNGNAASTSTDNTVTYDTVAPTVTINQASGQSDPTNGSPINYTVVFSESVTGFATGDVTIGGTASGTKTGTVTGSGTTYNVAVSGMTGSGTVIATIASSRATDTAGNGNAASTSTDNTVTYDITPPGSFSITGPSSPTNDTTPTITWGASSGASTYDIKVDNSSGACPSPVASTTNVAGTSWTVNTALSNGITYYVCVTAKDTVGNTTLATNNGTHVFTVDTVGPTVTIDQDPSQDDPTNASSIDFVVYFSESVNGFTSGDITLSGTAGATTATLTTPLDGGYIVAVSGMTGDGTVIASIGAGVFTDDAGNPNSASTSTDNTVTYDATPPGSFSITGPPNPTNNPSPTITWTASSGAASYDVSIDDSSGSCPSPVASTTGITGTSWNGGDVILTEGVTYYVCVTAKDTAGNSTAASNSGTYTFVIDTTPPGAFSITGPTDPTNDTTPTVTWGASSGAATYNVKVDDSSGACPSPVANTTGVTGTSWTVNTALSNGITYYVCVTAVDAATNTNLASNNGTYTFNVDTVGPTVTIDQDTLQDDPTNQSPIDFVVYFSESITGFTSGDVTLSGTAGADTAVIIPIDGGYAVQVSGMTGSGTVIATIGAGVVTDLAGNPNSASTSTDNTVTYDITPPSPNSVSINSGAAYTNNAEVTLNLSSTDSSGVSEMQLSCNNTNWTTAEAYNTNKAFNITNQLFAGCSPAQGLKTVYAKFKDTTGNWSTATSDIIIYDTQNPTVTINQAGGQADPTNSSPINFTVVFSESVTGFTTGDVTLSGTAGATTATVTGSGTTYNVAVSGMTGDGTVIATIASSRAIDAAGNGNTASTSTDNTVTYDTQGPTVTINQAIGGQADPTSTSPINFTVIFSESVTGFATGDVTIGGTASGTKTGTVTGSGTTYNVAVTGMTGDGTVIATIASSRAVDAAGNGNAASTSTDNTVTYDITGPTINSITSVAGDTTAPYYDNTNDSSTEIIFTSSDATTAVNACKWDSTNTTYASMANTCASTTSCTTNLTGEGAKTVYIRCIDDVGNAMGSSQAVGYTINATPPSASCLISEGTNQDYQFISGPTLYYNSNYTGSFILDVTASDTISGIEKVNFPTLTTGFSPTSTDDFISPYSQTYSWTTSATTSPGSNNATVYSNSGLTNTCRFTVTRDVTAPTGTITYSTQYINDLGTNPSMTIGSVTESDSGENTDSRTLQVSVGTLSNETCSAYGAYTTVSGYTGTYPTVVDSVTTLEQGKCYKYRWQVADNVGNVGTFTSANEFKVDTTVPATSVTNVTESSGDIYYEAGTTTVFYKTPASSQNFTVEASASDPQSGIQYVTFPGISASITPSTSQNDTTSPYSNPYTVTTSANTSYPTNTVTGLNNAGLSYSDNFAVTVDNAAPTGSSVTCPGAYDIDGNFNVTGNQGVDTGGSGVDTSAGKFQRRTGTLSGNSCTGYSAYGDVGTGTNLAQLGLTTGCYEYQYVTYDLVGNSATSSSCTVKVDTTPPSVSITSVTESSNYIYDNGSTLFYKNNVTTPGSFILNVSATDNDTGIASVSGDTDVGEIDFGDTPSDTAAPYLLTYTIEQNSTCTSPITVTATSNAGDTNFVDRTCTLDTTAPTIASLSDNGATSVKAGATVSITFNLTETGSGQTTNPTVTITQLNDTVLGTANYVSRTGTGNPYSYTYSYTVPTGNYSNVKVKVDASDNVSNAATQAVLTSAFNIDNTAPTVTINQAGAQADPTNTSPINFTVVFSESVTGFASNDVTLGGTGAPTTAVITGIGTTYNVAVSGMNDGTVTASVNAGGATDAAGNGNAASTSTDNTVTFDDTPPGSFSITGPSTPTNDTTPNITWGASSGASTYDVKVDDTSGACPSPVASTTNVVGTSWTVSPALSNGTTYYVCVTAKDAATNTTLASNNGTYTFAVDTTPPTVTINQAGGQSDPTNSSPINFTVVFSEPVTGFATGDVTIGGTASGTKTGTVTGSGTTYNVAVSGMTGTGTVIPTIGASVASDSAGNGNTASTSIDNTVTYDITPPASFSITGPADPTNDTTPNVTWGASSGAATYNVKVDDSSGACPSPVASTTGVTGTSWTVNTTLTNNTTYYVCVTAVDAASNTTLATNNGTYTFTVDTVGPTVTIDQSPEQEDPTNSSPIDFVVYFSESVTGFTSGDVTLSGTAGATTAVITPIDGGYIVSVSGMTGDGTVIAEIGAGTVTDAAGNPNSASTSTDNTITYDTTPPGAFSITGPTSPTNDTTPNITWGTSSDADTYDVKVDDSSGACPSPVASTTNVAGTSWTVNTPLTDGTTYYVCVTAKDTATNTTLASNNGTYSFTIDTTRPTVTINQAGGQADPTNSSPINFTVVFSESVTGFTTGDVTLSGTAGATTGTVTGSGTTYNVDVSGMTGTGTVIATIGGLVATDAANNGNTASSSTDNTVTYDITPPTITTVTEDDVDNYVTFGTAVNLTSDGADATSGIATCNAYWDDDDVSYDGDETFLTDMGTSCNGQVVTPDSTDGTWYYCVRPEDNVGLTNYECTNAITYDETGPTGTITNASGNPTNDDTPTLNLTISDSGVGTTGAEMRFSCNNTNWSSWEAYSATKSNFDIKPTVLTYGCPTTDGTRTVYVQYRDSLLNEGVSASTTAFILDTAPPTAPTLTCTNYTHNVWQNTNPSTTCTITDTATPSTRTATAYSINAGGSWTDNSNLLSFTFTPAANATTNVIMRISDTGGGPTESNYYSIKIDTLGPTGSITNQSGDPTNDTTPTLSLQVNDSGVELTGAEMRFSCNNTDWTSWESISEFKTDFNIKPAVAEYGCETTDGTRTVYVQYRDRLGNVGSSYDTGAFTLDTTALVISSTAPATGSYINTPVVSYTYSEAASSGSIVFTRTGGTTDANSPHTCTLQGTALEAGAHTNLTLAQGANACSQIWTSLVNGTIYTVTFNASDIASNPATEVNNTSVTYDTAGPTGTITNASGNPTNDDTPTLNLTIADTGVGTTGAQMRFSCNNFTWTAWEAYSTPKTNFDIKPATTAYGCATTDGTRTVNVQYRDSLLNEGPSASTTAFILDTTAPTTPTLTCTNYTHNVWQATNPSTTCTITDTATPSTRTATAYSTNGGADWTDNTNLLSFTFTPTANAITAVLMQISDTGGGPTNSNTYIIRTDSNPPSNGSTTYNNDYETDLSIQVNVNRGTDPLSGLSTIDSDYYLEYRSIGLSGGICGTFINNWADANVTENDTAISYNFTATNGNCYQFRYTVKDAVGNEATYTGTDTTKVSTTSPSVTSCTVMEGGNPDYQYQTGTTLYYNSGFTGSFVVYVSATDTVSGIEKVNFPYLAPGFIPTTPTGTDDTTVPYSQAYSWSTSATSSPGAKNATITSNSGLPNYCGFTVNRDVIPPQTGSIAYTTQYFTSPSNKATITVNDGTDVSGSGINEDTRILQRDTGTLSNGSCINYTGYVTTTSNEATNYPNIQDTGTMEDGKCYKYRWLVSDNVGNQATYSSASEVKYDSTVPSPPIPSVTEGSANIYYAGGLQRLYYKTPASNQFFLLSASPVDLQSGIESVTFPGLNAITPSTDVIDTSSPYSVTYTVTTSANTSPGIKQLISKNNAQLTNSANFTVIADLTPPTGASVSCPAPYDTDGNFNITGTSGSDSLSGIDTSASFFQRRDGTLINNSCNYGVNPFNNVGTANAVNLAQTSLSTGCYEYRYYTVDMVENSTTSSTCTVKVDTSVPTVSVNSVSETSNYIHYDGSTLYFTNVPAIPGSLSFNISAADSDSGINYVTGSTEFGDTPTDTYPPNNNPYYTLPYTIEQSATCTSPITAAAIANSGSTNFANTVCALDTAGPALGSTTYTDGYELGTGIFVTVDPGTDVASGLSTSNADYLLEYNRAPLSANNCGSYTGWTNAGVTETAASAGYAFTGVTDYCYQFRYSVRDNVYNQSTFTGTDTARIDTVPPTITSITSVAGDTTPPYYDITNDSSTSIIFVSSDAASAVAACKWDTSDIAYASMINTCTSPTNCVTNLSGDGVKNVYIRCIDLAGNPMTTSEQVTYTIYSTPPTVTDPHISIAGGTGTAGAYIVGNTVTVTWNNSATGDNNTDLTVDPTANLTGWGGSSTAAMTDTTACGGTANDNIWEACFTLVSGSLDNINVNTSVTATNIAGPTTGNDLTNATVDNEPPEITANGTLTITTDNGVLGIAALNNGTTNQDKVTQSAVTLAAPDGDTTTINLTALTGQATVNAATESGVVIPGALDNATQTFEITATDNAGNTNVTTTYSDPISVDNELPTVTTSAISVTGATGTGGIFITGDTATGRWNDSATGDNNSDTISSVSFNLTDWISTAGSISGTNNADIWTTSEQSPLDSQSTTGNNVLVTATDNAGNTTTTEGTNNYTIESLATDPANSSFTATPTSVMADGISTSLLTATLRDAASDPVAGATVSIGVTGANVRPINCTTAEVGIVTPGRSNSSGQACFLAVSSTMADNVEFTATDTSNSVVITQKTYVSYTNCLIDRSASTFAASKAQVATDGLDSANLNLHLIDACGFNVDKTNVVTLDDNSATSVTYTPPGLTAPQTYSTAGGGLLAAAISSITSGLFTFDAGLNEKQNDTTVYTENPGLPNEYNGSGSLIVGSANQDDTQVSFNMPFDFSIYDQTVTSGNPVYLCTNGFLSLTSGSCPASGALTDAIAGYHMDLTTNGGGIYQRTTTDSITFVFDSQTKSAEDVNFEIKLYNNNRIEIHYENAITAATPFIGLYNNSSVADASSLLAPRTNKATKFEYSSPITAFDLDSHPQVEFLAGDVNVDNSTVVAEPTAVTADGNSYSIVTVTVRDVNMNPISGRDIQLDQDGAAQVTQVDCGDLTTPAPLEPTDTNGEACYQATDAIAQLVTFTATDITNLPLILGSDTVDFGCVTGPGQQCVQVSLEAGTGSITMTAPSDFSFLPVSSGVFAQEQFTCDDTTLCPNNLTGYNLNVDDLLTVTDSRNLGGFTVQLQAATPFERADNIFLPFQNFYAATTPATTGGTKIGGIEYDTNYSGITCAGAPLNTAGSLLNANSFLYNFGTGNTIPSTIHDLMQCEVSQGQGRNSTMKQNVNYHLLLPALQPPGLYQVTLTYDLVI